MGVRITCSFCRRVHEAPSDAKAGDLLQCLCGEMLVVPAQTYEEARPEGTSSAKDPKLVIRCPNCSRRLRMRSTLIGKQVRCPMCGRHIVCAADGPYLVDPAKALPPREPPPPSPPAGRTQ